ncbi:phosphoethanolamine transferase [Klebsiella pneumoniae]|nr:phosphoethanolamine transferase [Klebsiella pneumoniae]
MLLVDEMKRGMAQGNASGKHLIILHTKGSHFNYTQRYPRSFAQWKPGVRRRRQQVLESGTDQFLRQ